MTPPVRLSLWVFNCVCLCGCSSPSSLPVVCVTMTTLRRQMLRARNLSCTLDGHMMMCGIIAARNNAACAVRECVPMLNAKQTLPSCKMILRHDVQRCATISGSDILNSINRYRIAAGWLACSGSSQWNTK